MKELNEAHYKKMLPSDEDGRNPTHVLKALEKLSDINRHKVSWKESIDLINKVMNTERAAVVFREEPSKAIFSGSFSQSSITDPDNLEFQIAGYVINNKKSYYSHDLSKSDLFNDSKCTDCCRNIISVPLKNKQEKVFGALQVVNSQHKTLFDKKDVMTVEALAAQVATVCHHKEKEVEMEQKVEQAEMLLAEFHHRLKNNLSTIIAIIEMEIDAMNTEFGKNILQKTIVRIASMMQVHDLLSRNSLVSEVDLKLYLEQLVKKICHTINADSLGVAISFEGESVSVSSDWAIHCGLLINELIVNAFKHAFEPDAENARITIRLSSDKGHIFLDISDNGKGVDYSTAHSSESLGRWLIDILLRSLDGTMKVLSNKGSHFAIRFPKAGN